MNLQQTDTNTRKVKDGSLLPTAVDIVVVSYNTCRLTLACLNSIRRETGTPHRVIVVDNGSHDGSAASIAEGFPDVLLIRSEENLGFAGAVNLAAGRLSAPWMLLLNSDAEVQDQAIDRLLAYAQTRPDQGIYGGRVLHPHRGVAAASCIGRPTVWSHFCHAVGLSFLFPGSIWFDSEAVRLRADDPPCHVDIVSGCFFLISTAAWRQLGGFDTRFFMYGEEADLCLRAAKLGLQPIALPAATVTHSGAASSERQADPIVQIARARITVMRRHWPKRWHVTIVPLAWLWAALRVAAAAILSLRSGPKASEQWRTWQSVWRRRSEWLAGY
ncbi:MAG: glycosyltransferase family 2 protein [Kiloniellales bacterium]